MRYHTSYCYFELRNDDCVRCRYTDSNPYDDVCVKRYDDMLHETISEIFRERCSLTSDQMKELLRTRENTDQESIIKLVLEKNPALGSVIPKKNNKLSLLWIALLGCYQKSAELLVRSGADVNERCASQSANLVHNKWTILHLLLNMYPSSWNERFVALVTDRGADLQAPDINGKTALHYAASRGRVEAIKLLLEKGAVVNVADNNGITPLLVAAAFSVKVNNIVPLMLTERGADVTVKDDFRGYNVLHYLAARAPDAEHTVDLAKVLIEKGASLDDRTTNFQFQPIHLAAGEGKNELVKLFLDHGANVNARAADGESPLFIAATCNNLAVLLTLLKRGANIDLKLSDGRTALHRACDAIYREKDNLKSIKILLSVGADICAENSAGKTALGTRIGWPRMKIRRFPDVRLLLKALALRKACLKPSIEFKDEMIIEQCPELRTYYQDCVRRSCETKSILLIDNCTLFDLLMKCPCQIAEFMHNRQFVKKFRQFDLDVLSGRYASDICGTFERAKLYHESTLKQEDVINEAVHNILPWMVVRKVARYTLDCEECELKTIVQASRKVCLQ